MKKFLKNNWFKVWILIIVFVLIAVYQAENIKADTSLADLIIQDFSWTPIAPTIDDSDAYLNVMFTVKNIGSETLNIATSTTFELNCTSYNCPNTNIGSFSIGSDIYSLSPGESKIHIFTTASNSGIKDNVGTFTLLLEADTTGLVSEVNMFNNSFQKTITIIEEKSDLKIDNIVAVNNAIKIIFSNIGVATTSSGFKIQCSGDMTIEETISDNIKTDSSKALIELYTGEYEDYIEISAEPRVYNLSCIIDSDNIVDEERENNNNFNKVIIVTSDPEGPDLIISKIILNPTNPEIDEYFEVDVYIKNIGRTEAADISSIPVVLIFGTNINGIDSCSGSCFASSTGNDYNGSINLGSISTLAVNQEKLIHFSKENYLEDEIKFESTGEYLMKAIVDDADKYNEVQENNNSLTKTIIITRTSDLNLNNDTDLNDELDIDDGGEEEFLNNQESGQLIEVSNTSLYSRLRGRIMLKVESVGEAYYIHPLTQEMYYLGRPDDAFSIMREQGIGITNSNLEKIPVGLGNLTGLDSDGDGLPDLFEDAIGTDKNNSDTDGDGNSDKVELQNNYNPNGSGKLIYDSGFSNVQKGKIFLQVERNGEAWYISPVDAKRYFLGRPADAFQVMRNLGLGISNNDFDSLSD